MKKFESKATISKKENTNSECDFFTFKKWEKNDKCRVYINDYKNRTLGYIDHNNDDEVIINDRQGNSQADIDFAIANFRNNYEF